MQETKVFQLCNPWGLDMYRFTVGPYGIVLVMTIVEGTHNSYVMLIEEARKLWSNLREDGYEDVS